MPFDSNYASHSIHPIVPTIRHRHPRKTQESWRGGGDHQTARRVPLGYDDVDLRDAVVVREASHVERYRGVLVVLTG